MIKDSRRYASTGGCGFPHFDDCKPASEAGAQHGLFLPRDRPRLATLAHWGVPTPVLSLKCKKSDPGITNVRDVSSLHWRRGLGVERSRPSAPPPPINTAPRRFRLAKYNGG
jgi:hypothetical protein